MLVLTSSDLQCACELSALRSHPLTAKDIKAKADGHRELRRERRALIAEGCGQPYGRRVQS